MLDIQTINLTLAGLCRHYENNDFSPRQLTQALLKANRDYNQENPIWIHLLSEEEVEPYLAAMETNPNKDLPLYGIPFAIKDNIDLAGIPTTAACPGFAYTPDESAFVVKQLIAAGAIPLGKTNLDQFATGLVGTRSPEPWGPCHNALNSEYISGGSSAGSSVAVAKGLASFSLGTDTAGSGRVPASLNNIVGLKPSRGLLSNTGLVPACRSLDCISIFALSCSDANQVLNVAAQYDPQDAYSRPNPFSNSKRYYQPITDATKITIGVPQAAQLEFFGDKEAEQLFAESIKLLEQTEAKIVEIDFEPFFQAATLLYQGPWVAERYLATQDLIEKSPDSLHPVIHTIVSKGKDPSALDTFSAQYQLQEHAQKAAQVLKQVDALVTPTNGTAYTVEQLLNDPIQLNSNMGYYTNFMNLLDYAAIAVPTGQFKNNLGFGITLFHKAMTDKRLLSLAAGVHKQANLKLGATQLTLEPDQTANPSHSTVDLVVCGAHLEGLPLNWQLQERGAVLQQKTHSSPHYKLYALAGGPPFRPGMIRVAEGGKAIEIEVWRLPMEELGSFVVEIPQPLGIGKVELNDGRWLPGFICEAAGIEGAKDITELGGWRKYLGTMNNT